MVFVLQFLLSFIVLYLSLSVVWPFVLCVVAFCKMDSNKVDNFSTIENSILVIIPAYKEDAVIVETARKALLHNYNKGLYKVVVLADSLEAKTLIDLEELGVEVFNVMLEKSTKARAINQAMSHYVKFDFDMVVVLDADNHMRYDFLNVMNQYYNLGFKAIQGRRSAKNSHTSVSVLDGISEELNNHILCKGQYLIGGSSRLSGSGMAFDTNVFINAMAQIDVINGFDKILELELVKTGIRITYAEDAIVLDEKVSQSEVFQKQRTRWLAAQYGCFVDNFRSALFQLFSKGNWSFFQKIVIFALPPKLLLPVVLFISSLLSMLCFGFGYLSIWLLLLIVLFVMTYVIAIPKQYWNKHSLVHLRKIPIAVLSTLFALVRMKSARDKFIHTPHTNNSLFETHL